MIAWFVSPAECRINYGKPVADPGFPRGGGINPVGAPTYDFAQFSQKLHEIKRSRTPGGAPHPPLDSPL